MHNWAVYCVSVCGDCEAEKPLRKNVRVWAVACFIFRVLLNSSSILILYAPSRAMLFLYSSIVGTLSKIFFITESPKSMKTSSRSTYWFPSFMVCRYVDYYDYKVSTAEGFNKERLFSILDGLEQRTRPLLKVYVHTCRHVSGCVTGRTCTQR